MGVNRISLMEAYQIETLRRNGISNEAIISQAKTGDIKLWQKLHEHFDFNVLLKLAEEDVDRLQEILMKGYKVKFITFNGLKNLLRLRFGKEQDNDYELMEKGIRQLVLNRDQTESVKQMLSGNWVLEEVIGEDEIVVSIELMY